MRSARLTIGLAITVACLHLLGRSVYGERRERIGPEIFVAASANGAYVNEPRVASDSGGNFVVGFTRGYEPTARRFDRHGAAVGTEFAVSPGSYVYNVSVAADDAGDFVVVWSDGYPAKVRARIYDARGPRGSDFPLTADFPSVQSQFDPHVGVAGTGEFVVVWKELQKVAADTQRLVARRFDAVGEPFAPPFEIASFFDRNAYPTIAGLGVAADKSFVVAWTDSYYGPKASARRYAADETPLAQASFVADEATMSANPSGAFTFAYSTSATEELLARQFDAGAAQRGAAFTVAPLAKSFASAMDAQGNAAFVWNNGGDVRGRRFRADGSAQGPEFVVASGVVTGYYGAISKSVASDAVGNLVVAWNDARRGIFARQVLQCGNGELDAGEQCDDGNAIGGDCCSADCQIEPPFGASCSCGNGIVDPGEACDDGNTLGGDCCAADCSHVEAQGTVCRQSSGYCDLVDVCDGTSGVCPGNAVRDEGTPCVTEDQCIERTTCKAGQCTGVPVCSATASQKQTKGGKAKPSLVVECSATTDGATEVGSCEAVAVAQNAIVAAMKNNAGKCRKDPGALTTCRKRRLASGRATFELKLTKAGRQKLQSQPNGELQVTVQVTIRRPQGKTASQVVPAVLHRR